jgi:hypothetical protein
MLTRLGQHQGMRPSFEQLRTDQFFKRDHMSRQCALGNQQRIGSRGEAQVLGYSLEGAQRVQRQPTAIDARLTHECYGAQDFV